MNDGVRCLARALCAVTLIAFLSAIVTTAAEMDAPMQWKQLPPLPDPEGFAAMFAGTTGEALLVAGGANFPKLRPWEGGVKQWYDSVWLLEAPDATWRRIGSLPQPTAYGVSATTAEGVVCAGGGNARRHFDDVHRLAWDGKQLHVEPLPRLPKPCSFCSGALVGKTLYICGGIERPDATRCLDNFWALDLSRPGSKWQVLTPCPGGPRMLAVAGAGEHDFYLFSGTRLKPDAVGQPQREYLRDAWRFRPGGGWQRLADLPRSAVAAATPAPLTRDGRFLVCSGDDGTKVNFKPETEHPGFPRDVLAYDPAADRWQTWGAMPFSRATVPAVAWGERTVIPSGEARPGYRTPEVWTLNLSSR
jgi:N-acetylneuraminate epimerase